MGENPFEFAPVMASPEDIPPHLRTVVVAYRLDRDMSYDELATCLQVSAEAARALVERVQRRACWSSNLNKLLSLSSDVGPVSTTGPDGHWSGAFRFMELPPEIRERIYGYVVTPLKNQCLDYARFWRPAILAVSKQVRREAKATFYSKNEFEIEIGSNFECRQGLQTLNNGVLDKHRHWTRTTGKAGILLQHAEMSSTDLLEKSLFRNIVFRVCDVNLLADIAPSELGLRSNILENYIVTVLFLQWSGTDGLRVWYEEGPDYPVTPAKGPARLRANDVDDAMEEVCDVATTVAERDGFKGFTADDLRTVSRAFRHEGWNSSTS